MKFNKIQKFEDYKLNEGKKISFRDMGISDLMDLKLYTDKLAKANIDWNQKGQALVFNNANDAKKAKQLLGLDEGKLTEAKGGWALYIDGEKIKSFRSKREALRALQLVQLSDNSVKLKKEGKLYEEVNWYVSIARTVKVKTLKGKTVTLKKGDQGHTEKKSWGDTRVYIDDYVFDADQFKNDDLDLHDKPRR